MNGKIGLLGGLFAAQLLFIAGLLLNSGLGSDASAPQLLSFDPANVTGLTVSGEDKTISLARDGDLWRLDDGAADGTPDGTPNGLPADGGKISELLEKLSTLDAPWPVATSADSAERFEVTDVNHQRRLVVAGEDGPLADLLLGTSPGYRRVHARLNGENEVYSIDFSNYEAPTDADQWLDKALLAAEGEVSAVALEGAWQLTRQDGEWLIDGAPADAEAADDLVRRFTGLRVLGMAEEDDSEGDAEDEADPAGVFLVTDEAGEHRLTLHHEAEEDDYNLVSDRVAGRFEVATYIAEQMLADPADLQADEADQEADATDEAAESQDNVLDEGAPSDQES